MLAHSVDVFDTTVHTAPNGWFVSAASTDFELPDVQPIAIARANEARTTYLRMTITLQQRARDEY